MHEKKNRTNSKKIDSNVNCEDNKIRLTEYNSKTKE